MKCISDIVQSHAGSESKPDSDEGPCAHHSTSNMLDTQCYNTLSRVVPPASCLQHCHAVLSVSKVCAIHISDDYLSGLCGFAPVDSNILLGGKVGVFETPS